MPGMTQHRTTPTLIADRLSAALDGGGAAGPPAERSRPATSADDDPPPAGAAPRAGVAPPPEMAPVCVEEAWRRARLDYAAGVSGPVAAERHGLNARTLRRRAAAEGWTAQRSAGGRASRTGSWHAMMLDAPPPLFAGEPATPDEAADGDPELRMFVDAHSFEVGELLMHPEPARLGRFAFRRAAEAAAKGAVAEAGAWMRLAAQVGRAADKLDRAMHPVRGADLLRARYAAQLRAAADGALDDDPEFDDEGGPDAPDGGRLSA